MVKVSSLLIFLSILSEFVFEGYMKFLNEKRSDAFPSLLHEFKLGHHYISRQSSATCCQGDVAEIH